MGRGRRDCRRIEGREAKLGPYRTSSKNDLTTEFTMAITTCSNDIKERLSIAYLTAVAARAGCQVSKLDVDKQSVDATVRPISGGKISIDFQLKATSSTCLGEADVSFDLPIKNYDDLRDLHSTAPHYLIVFILDEDESAWLANDENALLIRRCAYWLDLRGKPETSNRHTTTVKLPRSQIFDVVALKAMIQQAYDQARGIGEKG